MMIKKFNRINNAFSYSFFDWDVVNPSTYIDKQGRAQTRQTSFVKSNIIFAENGNGKSKLVSILKSLNDHADSIDKHRDRQAETQEIKVEIDGGPAIEFTATWNRDDLKNKILFFDKDFIDSSVHSTGSDLSDTAQRKQRRGRDIVYLGNFAEYNEEIERVDGLRNLVKERASSLIDSERETISTLIHPLGLSVEDLATVKDKIIGLVPADLRNLQDSLTEAQSDLSKVNIALKDKGRIAALSLLQQVPGNFSLRTQNTEGIDVPLDPVGLLDFTAAKGVQTTLHKIDHKKEFIKRGLSLIAEDTLTCPFCEQPIKQDQLLQIIQDYQEIFDATFLQEERNVRDQLTIYKNKLEALRDIQAPSTNQAAVESLNTFETVTITLPALGVSEEQKAVIKSELELVSRKERGILEKVEGSNSITIEETMSEVNSQVSAYNEQANMINTQIVRLKTDTDEGKLETKKNSLEESIAKLKADIFFLENKSAFEAYFLALQRDETNVKTVNSLDRIHKGLKVKIVQEFKTFVDEYFSLIATFANQISPSMDILEIKGQPTYDERSPRDPAQCGFRVEYNKQDCTGSLSEGERQVIALGFFFARLSKEIDKSKIIVLDDPITSFDTGKRKSTAELIEKAGRDYSQLFILTCDPLFREYCLKQITNNRNFYYILKTAGSSAIHYTPSLKETIYSSFEEDFKNIDTVLGTNENVVVYGQKLRFCLETKIREDYFGLSEDHLSNMIKKVTEHGKAKFDKLFDNKDAILEIYSYCNTGGLAHYPKDGATSWNELKDKIKKYLALSL